MAIEKGTKSAFMYYVADSAIQLLPDNYPLTGDKVRQSYSKLFTDTTIILWWHPLNQWLSPTGDIGYTYGTWERTKTNDKTYISKGTYYTLWKEQKDGSWKFLFDTGEIGLPDSEKNIIP